MYNGYLKEHVPLILRLHKEGYTPLRIAERLDALGVTTYGTHNLAHVSGETGRLSNMVRHVLIRYGKVKTRNKKYQTKPSGLWQWLA